ncbi:hypothetical protein GF322_04130 [Candidatus Dependentiae bacterium]|nr:hypothetical protein [Candidatus Dependentiae bacterium]
MLNQMFLCLFFFLCPNAMCTKLTLNTKIPAQIEESANKFIEFINTNNGHQLLQDLSNHNMQEEIINIFLTDISTSPKDIRKLFNFFQIIYSDKEIFFYYEIQEELKKAFANYIIAESAVYPDITTNLHEYFINHNGNIDPGTLLLFIDLIEYPNVTNIINTKLNVKNSNQNYSYRFCIIL